MSNLPTATFVNILISQPRKKMASKNEREIQEDIAKQGIEHN